MRRFYLYVVTIALFVAIVAATDPLSYGDTPVYVSDVVTSIEQAFTGVDPMWEFGHVLWRPLGYITWLATRPFLATLVNNNRYLEIFSAFVVLNYIAGLLCAILICLISRRFGLSDSRAIVVTIFFLGTNAVLNYMQSGTAYVPGLFFQLLAVYCFIQATERQPLSMLSTIIGGLALGFAALMWFVYVLTIPAALILAYVWRLDSFRRNAPESKRRLRAAFIAGATAASVIVFCYGAVAIRNDLTDPAAFVAWYRDASHGLLQTRQLLRLPMGLARAFIEMGSDGLLLKRYLLRDPYAARIGS